MDTREIARIVATKTARIDLPIWLRSEPYILGSVTVTDRLRDMVRVRIRIRPK